VAVGVGVWVGVGVGVGGGGCTGLLGVGVATGACGVDGEGLTDVICCGTGVEWGLEPAPACGSSARTLRAASMIRAADAAEIEPERSACSVSLIKVSRVPRAAPYRR
jgi:hypothetical protein